MFDIKALRQRKEDTKAKASAFLQAAQDAKRDLTDAERADYDTCMAQIASLNSDIKRVEQLMDEERHSGDVASAVAAGAGNAKEAPWKSLGEQLQAIRRAAMGGQMDPRLFAAQGANETVPAEGGFLVVPEFSEEILQRTYETGEVASRCFDQPMNSNRLIMHAVDEDSRVDGSRWGGIQGYWISEAASYTGTKPKFRDIQLIANKLVGLVYVTEEQLEDGPALEAYIRKVVPEEFAFKVDDAIINGSGTGVPLGILNSGANYVLAAESGQTTLTILTNNILKMWQHLWAPSRKDAVWFINQDVEQQLYTLALAAPSAAVLFTSPLFTPAGVNGNVYGKLLGRDVIAIEQCASLTTNGDIILADMSQYILARKGGVRADSSIHVAFLTGEMAFRWMMRMDGQPWWKKPLTPKNGTNVLSPFVTLASR